MNFDFQIIGLSDFRISATFHFEERLTAYKKAPSDLEPVIKKFYLFFLDCDLAVIIKMVMLQTWIRNFYPSC